MTFVVVVRTVVVVGDVMLVGDVLVVKDAVVWSGSGARGCFFLGSGSGDK